MGNVKYRDKKWLLKIAKALAKELKVRCRGTAIKIRIPSRATSTNTRGWSATIGNLGRSKISMQVWLDSFTGHEERKLWAAFHGTRQQIKTLANKAKTTIFPIREITFNDTRENNTGNVFLAKRLTKKEFGHPILEKHGQGETYLGKYEYSSPSLSKTESHFMATAAAFFESAAMLFCKNDTPLRRELEVYPKVENRKQVSKHLQRERNSYLATQCKTRDNYTCRVCRLNFEKYYGKLGEGFAEAHHLKPLHQLHGKVMTQLEDLITVCSNCHRMLHKMSGNPNDYHKLQGLLNKRHLSR